MFPPVFQVCAANAGVQAALGNNPVRLFPAFDEQRFTDRPYAIFQITGGSPENYISNVPDIDSWSVQFDVYAPTLDGARGAAQALRDAIEPVAHISFWGGEIREPDTTLYRYLFTVDWWHSR
jgi:hypothetical protein